MPRLFVALDIPDDVAEHLLMQSHGVVGARWQRREQLHITLAFIGNVDRGMQNVIDDALADMKFAPAMWAVNRAGQFGGCDAPRALWAGIEDLDGLKKLHTAVSQTLLDIGVRLEKRKFLPHITLARFPRSGFISGVDSWVAVNEGLKSKPVEALEFHLYSSKQTELGSQYQVEATYRVNHR